MLKINHIGYAVKKLESAIKHMEEIGFVFGNTVEDKDRNIYITFGNKDGYCIELVSPISKGSPVDKILNNAGAAPYHICYESDSFNKDIRKMIQGGYRMVIEAAPAPAFGGRKVTFLYSLSVGLIEILEKYKDDENGYKEKL